MLEKGLVQIYTGDGKGKTTAAFGLALRAAGHGNRVLICQFLKPSSLDLGERSAVRSVAGVTLKIVDEPWDMRRSFEDREALRRTKAAIDRIFAELVKAAVEKTYDMIILDEIVFCLARGLVALENIKSIIENRNRAVEIVMTGRGATDELMALADMVREMKTVKHPFEKGTKARKGIEF